MDKVVVAYFNPQPMLILGNFNAKYRTWGSSRTDVRSELVAEWTAGLVLRLLNVSTCVLSWASLSAVRRISGWKVMEVENFSDHNVCPPQQQWEQRPPAS
ncbi:hypothetical protein K0M31_001875 [Melipona bicolor]|uniref:Endonuclease/exonuclease/phosphatase domain-containing protein n=1 Tax=Melipona bicolor TaxID=60889 RepID=A0AA40GGI4_9HYME|nr:hypothetical protein K0M31_001875 [Melipona bicolor]